MRRLVTLTWFSLLLCATAHARTGAQLVADLRIMLGQTDSTTGNTNWTNAQLRSCLNMGQDKVSGRGRVIEMETTYAASATTDYAPPSGFITLRGTAYLKRGGVVVKAIPLTSADSVARLGTRLTRQAFGDDNHLIFEDGGKIRVVPPPLTMDSVVVVFFANPAAIDTAECEYGDEWEIVLLYEAKMVALEKIRDGDWYALTKQERDTLLSEMYKQTKLRPQMVAIP